MPFKILSVERFPEVNITLFPTSIEETSLWLQEMDELFTKEAPFVLVYSKFDPAQFATIDEKVSQVSRKNIIVWLKKNRALFIEKCRGIILTLNDDQSDLLMIQQQKSQLEAVYRVPVRILYDEADKHDVTASLLAY